ncbi:MAG: hypothetical protein AB1391_01740 [Candidatus Micrarchaeota archaeon]
MYIKQTIQETYDLITKNKTNLILYALLQIAFLFALFVITVGSLIIGGIIGGINTAHVLSSENPTILDVISSITTIGLPLILWIAFYIITLIIFFIFMSLIFTRLIYLTSKGTVMPITMASVSTLINYAKTNFIQYFKLLFTIIILVFFVNLVLLILFVVLVLSLSFFGSFIKEIIPILSIIFVLILSFVFVLLWIILDIFSAAAITMFFMGNENIGSIKLLRAGWRLFISNLIEFVLFMLVALIVVLFVLIVKLILSIIPYCGMILGYIISYTLMFAIGVAWFVFIAHLVEKQQKTATSTII